MTNGGYLTKEQILQAQDLKYEDVSMPEWGGVVRIREMTAAESEDFANAVVAANAAAGGRLENVRATLVSLCAVDGAGNRLFSTDDVVQIGKKSAAALKRLFVACQGLNAMTPAEVKEIAKNSEPGQSAASSSD